MNNSGEKNQDKNWDGNKYLNENIDIHIDIVSEATSTLILWKYTSCV